jgi:hypothetical protein
LEEADAPLILGQPRGGDAARCAAAHHDDVEPLAQRWTPIAIDPT